jgi:dTDP-L-rhamnose 4-epimerase
MSIYGEGLCKTAAGDEASPDERPASSLRAGHWELTDANGKPLVPMATPETKQPTLSSVYALNKYAQERLCLMIGKAYGIPTAALRFFNVYGPRQALSNPYTGVLAIFAARLLNGKPPMVFEDGEQRRDFVHVSDVARAFVLALNEPAANGEVINIGSGENRTVREVATLQANSMGRPEISPLITNQARAGDIRHNIPDLTKAQTVLGYRAKAKFSTGLEELAEWVARQEAVDRVEQARQELELRGLVA